MRELIGFFGSESKAGTTMLSQSFAEVLTDKNYRTLYIQASGEMFDSFLPPDHEPGIDSLRELEPDRIWKDLVTRIIRKNGRLDYIKGAEYPLMVEYFSTEVIGLIADLVKDDYDYIVVDGGHNFRYPLPVSALQAAQKRFFVVKAANRSVARFGEEYENTIRMITEKSGNQLFPDVILINDYQKSECTFTPDAIRERFHQDTAVIYHVSGAAACEAANQTLISLKSGNRFQTSVEALVQKVLTEDM